MEAPPQSIVPEQKEKDEEEQELSLQEDYRIKSRDGPPEARQAVLAKRKERNKLARDELKSRLESAPNAIVVDLGFLDCMDEKSIKSLALQIWVIVSYMRIASHPFSIHLAPFDESTAFGSAMVRSFLTEPSRSADGCVGLKFHRKPLCELISQPSSFFSLSDDRPQQQPTPTGQILYLSPDADDTLREKISPGQIFVIGGIVDGTRIKNLTRDEAKRLGIRSVKLPVAEYLIPTRDCVLNVSDVGELLSLYVELNDWQAVFARFMHEGRNAHRFAKK